MGVNLASIDLLGRAWDDSGFSNISTRLTIHADYSRLAVINARPQAHILIIVIDETTAPEPNGFSRKWYLHLPLKDPLRSTQLRDTVHLCKTSLKMVPAKMRQYWWAILHTRTSPKRADWTEECLCTHAFLAGAECAFWYQQPPRTAYRLQYFVLRDMWSIVNWKCRFLFGWGAFWVSGQRAELNRTTMDSCMSSKDFEIELNSICLEGKSHIF